MSDNINTVEAISALPQIRAEGEELIYILSGSQLCDVIKQAISFSPR
jgi:hypothetical protein